MRFVPQHYQLPTTHSSTQQSSQTIKPWSSDTPTRSFMPYSIAHAHLPCKIPCCIQIGSTYRPFQPYVNTSAPELFTVSPGCSDAQPYYCAVPAEPPLLNCILNPACRLLTSAPGRALHCQPRVQRHSAKLIHLPCRVSTVKSTVNPGSCLLTSASGGALDCQPRCSDTRPYQHTATAELRT